MNSQLENILQINIIVTIVEGFTNNNATTAPNENPANKEEICSSDMLFSISWFNVFF